MLGSIPMNRSIWHCRTNQKPRCYPPVMRWRWIRLPGCAARWRGSIGLRLNGKIPSDEMTRLIYTLKEIRACLEAEI